MNHSGSKRHEMFYLRPVSEPSKPVVGYLGYLLIRFKKIVIRISPRISQFLRSPKEIIFQKMGLLWGFLKRMNGLCVLFFAF